VAPVFGDGVDPTGPVRRFRRPRPGGLGVPGGCTSIHLRDRV